MLSATGKVPAPANKSGFAMGTSLLALAWFTFPGTGAITTSSALSGATQPQGFGTVQCQQCVFGTRSRVVKATAVVLKGKTTALEEGRATGPARKRPAVKAGLPGTLGLAGPQFACLPSGRSPRRGWLCLFDPG